MLFGFFSGFLFHFLVKSAHCCTIHQSCAVIFDRIMKRPVTLTTRHYYGGLFHFETIGFITGCNNNKKKIPWNVFIHDGTVSHPGPVCVCLIYLAKPVEVRHLNAPYIPNYTQSTKLPVTSPGCVCVCMCVCLSGRFIRSHTWWQTVKSFHAS